MNSTSNDTRTTETRRNDTIHLLETRRSAPVPFLVEPGPSPREVEQILTIAARVPDHGKLAPWRFIVFSGAGKARAAAIVGDAFAAANPDASADRMEAERRRFAAPLVIAVVSSAGPHHKIPEWEQVLSSGAVCMNLCIAANAMGFATVWLTEWYAYDRGVLERLGLAAHERIAGFVSLGTASGPRDERPRPVVADITTHFSG
ncbi:Nitroreductase [Beijerinckiaceae bacterium RH AL1]|nr:nitroreductase [Beijerinckiaceae bacterium]VVB45322.1 Nitroreductase [Beijerinckiaceae bacterium RH CH11]VVB45400.1 Nitroreductase [Beijerinckiaceae bacterium RH AL8]VVC54807.1 Nitroreductase [Beijerinckiaceae bacterium RH AL1]